jgi:glycerol kinase
MNTIFFTKNLIFFCQKYQMIDFLSTFTASKSRSIMEKYVLALDQGTTSSRAIVFDRKGSAIAIAQKEFAQIYPQPGWVEHDPMEIWASQMEVITTVLTRNNLQISQMVAAGITNQRETAIVWERATGRPVYNAIVWQDRRTADYCDQLKKEGIAEIIREKTGLIVDAYFSATKVKWILDHVAGARDKAIRGELAFGTVDSWLVWQLSQGKLHITDVSNASRTMLYNIHTLEWDKDLLTLFDIPASMLPQVRQSSEIYGETTIPQLAGIPLGGIAGDQQAALFGQMCIRKGMVKNTYGTGCFMMMNTGEQPVKSLNNLLTTIAWRINGQTVYALEGSIFIAGAVVQWLRDELGIIRSSSEVEELCHKVSDSGGVYFVPAFAGLGAPYWDQHARGSIFGITRGTTAAHIARAAVDSIALQTLDVLHAMQADAKIDIAELRVDGGAVVNDMLMQFQADIAGVNAARPKVTETTALGAAYLAGLATGFWNDISEIEQQWQIDCVFHPDMPSQKTEKIISEWHRAVRAVQNWSEKV